MMKKRSITITLLFLVFIFLSLAAACSGANGTLVLEEEFEDGRVFEYAEEIQLPSAHLADAEGNIVSYDVTYAVVAADGSVEENSFPVFKLGKGDYTARYSSGKQILEKKFSVQDRLAPVVTFSNIPTSLFLGESETGVLPTVLTEDASTVTVSATLKFTDSQGRVTDNYEFNKLTNRYSLIDSGTFTYTIVATDDSENQTTESVSWLVKDSAWKDPALAEGYLADYDEENYANLVSNGDINTWYNCTFTEEHLDSWQGAKGVRKITLYPSASSHASIRLKMSGSVSPNGLGNKILLVRMYADTSQIQAMLLAGNEKVADNGTSCSTKLVEVADGWISLELTAEDLINLKCCANADSPLEYLQIGFAATPGRQSIDIYFDSITIAEKLPAPTGLVGSEGTVTWQAVANASAYSVIENGVATQVTDTNYTLQSEKAFVEVSAIGDGIFYADSLRASVTVGLQAKENEYASYDDTLYTNLINTNISFGSETGGYRPTSLSSRYIPEEGFSVSLGAGGWGICSAIRLDFPAAVTKDTYGYLTLRLKFNSDMENIWMRITNIGTNVFYAPGASEPYFKELSDGWFDYVVDLSVYSEAELRGIQLCFTTTDASAIGTIDFTIQSIYRQEILEMPVLSHNHETRTVSWSAVENALGYEVVLADGSVVELDKDTLSYVYEEGEYGTMKVRAVGDGKYIADSEYAEILYDSRERLSAPENLQYDRNTSILSWDAVDGANGYRVTIGTETTDVTQASISLAERDGYLRITVAAKGDQSATVDSLASEWAGDPKLAGNTVMDFGNGYEALISTEIEKGAETVGYKPTSLNVTPSSDGMSVSLGAGAWGICSAVRIDFPTALTSAEYGKLVLRIKFDTDMSNKTLRISNIGTNIFPRTDGNYFFEGSEMTGEYIDYVVDLSAYPEAALSGIQLCFLTTDSSSVGVIDFTIQSISLQLE